MSARSEEKQRQRTRAKQAERRRQHRDKYAATETDDRLADLGDHYASEERADERR